MDVKQYWGVSFCCYVYVVVVIIVVLRVFFCLGGFLVFCLFCFLLFLLYNSFVFMIELGFLWDSHVLETCVSLHPYAFLMFFILLFFYFVCFVKFQSISYCMCFYSLIIP